MSRTPKEPTDRPLGRLPDRARSFRASQPGRTHRYSSAPGKESRPAAESLATLCHWVLGSRRRYRGRGDGRLAATQSAELDAVEKVADAYLKALSGEEPETARTVWDRRRTAGHSLGFSISA